MNNESSFDIIQESNPVQTVAPTKEDNEMLRATEKITALYCRLSVKDTKDEKKNGKEDPSNSIQHQQVMLMQYAKANRLPNPTYFIDDGYSGVTYVTGLSPPFCLALKQGFSASMSPSVHRPV